MVAAVAVVGALVATVWLLFAPALPGIVHFDDQGNLSDLATISGFDSAWRWIHQGRAGPLGRPLALATFALQYYQWPRPDVFLAWNIALHVINALLVFWLAMLIAQRMGERAVRQVVIGFCVALVWAAMPLLNTSVLFIVQRMTLLCSTFTLAGLIAYLKCRGALRASWRRQIAALSVLGGFGVLALLSKENGALIVVYALVLELGLTAVARERRPTFGALALLLACVVLLVKLLPLAFWSTCMELQRGFTVTERLGSQGVLLLVYLKGLFLPAAGDMNPFRFQHLLQDIPNIQWGVVVWAVLMASPLVAWWRGWRLAALALSWFFYGHIMESGWIALEPYFAHRNYLPAIGLVFALVYGVLAVPQGARLWRGAFAAYVVVLAGMTWMNTSLWGNRELAAEIWVKEQPRSERAAMYLAYEIDRTQGIEAAQRFLDKFMTEERDSPSLRLQSLISACQMNPSGNYSEQVRGVRNAIATLPYEGWGTDLIEKLMEPVRTHQCQGVSAAQVAEIAAAYLSQPAYQCNRPVAHNMLSIIGLVAMQDGDMRTAMDFYLRALEESVQYGMANMFLDLAKQQGDRAAIEKLRALVVNAPLPRGTTQAEWAQLLARIDAQLRATAPTGSTDTPAAATADAKHLSRQ